MSALTPYEGIENTRYYEYLRIGVIQSIDTKIPSLSGKASRVTYGTAQVQWVDVRLGILDEIPIAFPNAGQGWGIISYPRVGDVCTVGFRPGGFAVILGYLQSNPFLERGSVNKRGYRGPLIPTGSGGNPIAYRPTRFLTGGEILMKSFQGAEAYFDRFANLRLIARQPRSDSQLTDASQLAGDITLSQEKAKIIEITMGKARVDDRYLVSPDGTEGFTPVDVPKASFNGTDVNFDLAHASGFSLQVDKEGSFGIQSPKDFLFSANNNVTLQAGVKYTIVINGTNGSVSLVLSSDGSMTLTDGNGSTITLDGLGTISVASPNGTNIELEDDNVQIATSLGTGVVVDELSQSVTVNAQNVQINGGAIALGSNATHPVTVSDLMAVAFNRLVVAFNTHTHIYSPGPGGPTPTPPPAIPAIPVVPSQISSIVAIAE